MKETTTVLIVSVSRLLSNHGQSIKTKCDTFVFQNEEEGKTFIEQNKNSVYHVQKAKMVPEKISRGIY